MIESLDMHILDLFQNALASGATDVSVRLACPPGESRLWLEIRDNGRGMDDETLAAVKRGYYSSKCPRCVGLGIPLLRATAEHCGGSFSIDSRPGEGTRVTATFDLRHIDLPPFGDLVETSLALVVTSGDRRVRLAFECGDALQLDTADLERELGGVPRNHPDVIGLLRAELAQYFGRESVRRALAGHGTPTADQGTIAHPGTAS